MRNSLVQQLEPELAPLCEVHGVELVALEWFQGAGRGLLRLTVDLAHGDPRVQDPARSVGVDTLTHITRDVSSALDALEASETVVIDVPYQLEVTSPGPERPLQKREDYERFAGLRARLDMAPRFEGPSTLRGVLEGTRDPQREGDRFMVRITAHGRTMEVSASQIARGRLEPIVPPKKERPGKATSASAGSASRRQARLEARARARAINDEHLRRKRAEAASEERGQRSASASAEGIEIAEGARAPSGAER